MYFRAMTPATDGRPLVGRSARALGVRVPDDIAPNEAGDVAPGSGGMSVSPGSMWNLPSHRRPRGMLRGSTGAGRDAVFVVEEGAFVGRDLSVRPDPARPTHHAFVEPAQVVALSHYESCVAATRPDWRRVWP